MDELLHDAFHFESLVWHGPIALYLFLLGLSAGATLIGLGLKRWVLKEPASQSGFIRAVAIIAPLGIVISLLILIMHLTKPAAFWKLMLYYNLNSVMSVGVMMFQVYTAILLVWLALVFQPLLERVLATLWKGKLKGLQKGFSNLMARIAPFEFSIELLLAVLAIALGMYTGFLLSALKTYPMLDNPWLPVLFLFSGLSSGAAGTLLLGVIGFKEPTTSAAAHWVHSLEKPVIFLEMLVLGIFFAWLIVGGGRSEIAALAAIGSGFWASVFWLGVVAVGLVMPLAMHTLVPATVQHRVGFIITITSSSLIGVISLRYFILYAGQMTVV